MIEYGCKTKKEVKAMQSEIKKNIYREPTVKGREPTVKGRRPELKSRVWTRRKK